MEFAKSRKKRFGLMRQPLKVVFKALFVVTTLLQLYACEPQYDEESHWEEGELGVLSQGLTVGEAGGCSTSIVNALSAQLIEEINCLRPNTLRDFTGPNMSLGPAVWPFLQGDGPEDLAAAIDARGQTIQINSALRTLPQQYLLYRWHQQGRCNIRAAARPGRSRHESGLAIDISNNSAWRTSLANQRFDWFGAGDPVHFDYIGGNTTDLAGLSILAFQQLGIATIPTISSPRMVFTISKQSRESNSPCRRLRNFGCVEPAVDAAIPVEPETLDMTVSPEVDLSRHTEADAEEVTQLDQTTNPPDAYNETVPIDRGYEDTTLGDQLLGENNAMCHRMHGHCEQSPPSSAHWLMLLSLWGFISRPKRRQAAKLGILPIFVVNDTVDTIEVISLLCSYRRPKHP